MAVYLYPPLSLSTLPAPTSFVENGANTIVTMDTVTPANIKALPTELIFKKDGVNTRVTYDTLTPSNSNPIPVNIVSANGVGINTTVDLQGAQINVQLTDRGLSPDAVRVGNGTNLMGVNASLEALTHDQGAIDILTTIDADTSALRATISTEGGAQPANVLLVGGHDGAGNSRHILVDVSGRQSVNVNSSALPTGGATSANQATEITALGSLLTELQLKADLTDTQPVSIAGTVAVSGPLTDSQLRATAVPVSGTVTANTGLNPLTDAQLRATAVPVSGTFFQATQPVSAAALPLPSGASTEATLSALNGKVPANLTVSATRLLVDGSGVTQPVSGTLTTNKNYISGTPKAAQITVGTSQVRATTDAAAPSATRQLLKIKPSRNNTGAIFLIPTGGTISTGMEIMGPDRLEFEYDPTDYYLISDTVGQIVEIFEVE